MDNTLEGHLFDTQLITSLARANTPMAIERTQPSLIIVRIFSMQDDSVIKMHELTKAHN
jgi:hypothetical protein